MDDFLDLGGERGKQLRKADALAKLRAGAAPGAADRLAAVGSEPDPTRVHLGMLKRIFPNLPRVYLPWGRPGLPSMDSVRDLLTLRAYFSPKKKVASPLPVPKTDAACIAELTRHFRGR